MYLLWIFASLLNLMHFVTTDTLNQKVAQVLIHIFVGMSLVASLVLLFAPVLLIHLSVASSVVLMSFVIAGLGFGAGMLSFGNRLTSALKLGSLLACVFVGLMIFKTLA